VIDSLKKTYEKAFRLLGEGNELEAYDAFLTTADNLASSAKGPVPLAVQFGYWEAIVMKLDLADGAGVKDAFPLMEELAKKVPDTKFLPDTFKEKFAYYINKGDKAGITNAQTVVNNYKKAALERPMPAFYGKEAQMLDLVVQRKAGQITPAKAREELASFLNTVDAEFPTLANRARLEIGAALLDEKKIPEARDYFHSIIEDAKADDATMAGAYLGRGHTAFMKEGRTSEDAREALLDYLRLYTFYPQVNAETVAEALYYAAKAMELYSTSDTKVNDVRRIRGRLKGDPLYRGTSWAKK
jgi:hypothetical protein